MKRSIRMVALAMTLVLMGGCFGSFPLVTKVHSFNKDVGDKWVQELVFLALVIIPVYELAALGDALIFNTIEFWGGNSPLDTRASLLEDGSELELSSADADAVRVRHLAGDQVLQNVEIVRVGQSAMLVRDADGNVLSTLERLPDGSVAVGRDGELRRIDAAQIRELETSAKKGSLTSAARMLLWSDAMIAAQ